MSASERAAGDDKDDKGTQMANAAGRFTRAISRHAIQRTVAGSMTLFLLIGGTFVFGAQGVGAAQSVLGTKDPAHGQPVKIGLISDGLGVATNNTDEVSLSKAMVPYLNQYRGGIGGRPIQLDVCIAHGDPGSSADCANQMIQDNVVAVVMGALASADTVWQILHSANVPEFTGSATSTNLLLDTKDMFIMDNPLASLVGAPAALAKSKHLGKVTEVVIDVPSATDFGKNSAPHFFAQQNMQFAMVAVPQGTADMTPQMQSLASSRPGVVQIVGDDTFCTAALNGLREVGYKGPIAIISQCMSNALRKAVPGSFLKSVTMTATAPTSDANDPDVKLRAAIAHTFSKSQIDLSAGDTTGIYTSMMAMAQALHAITGPVTPATVAATMKAMPQLHLPLGGGVYWRCNGKPVAFLPAVCVRGVLLATLNDKGLPVSYKAVSNTPIGS